VKGKYKEYLKLNRNIFIAFAFDILVTSIVAQLLAEQQDSLNATFSLLVDHAVFLSVLGILLYNDNRKKYKVDSGKTNWSLLKIDLVKMISSLGISEIIYSIVRWVSQYYFLTIEYEPYLSSLIGQAFAIIVYLIVVNSLFKITKIFKDSNES